MISRPEESPLHVIANPKSIAFFGASNNFSAMGTSILRSVLSFGFSGNVYPVHPKQETVLNLPAYPDVAATPEAADLAFIVLPTRLVTETLDACGKKGIRRAVIVSAGFNEVGGDGPDRQAELMAVARRHNIRFTGPNCIGMVNTHYRLNATFLPHEGRPGSIGIASHSGSFVTQMFSYLNSQFGQGFSTGFSLGNEADIDMVDCLEYLGACPNTKVIALYVESIRRGRAFIDAARAVAGIKPIVAFYAGGSETGRRACLSHTGAMAGPDRLYDGVFRQSGIIRARSIQEMFDFCHVLGAAPLPENNRVIIQTHSGGPGAAAADACGRTGIELPALSAATLEKLAPFVPHTGSVGNPVDLTFTKNPLDFFHAIPNALLEENNAGGLLVYFLATELMVRRALIALGVPEDEVAAQADKIIDDQCAAVAGLIAAHGKPVVGFSFLTRINPFITGLQGKGVPVIAGPERAARAYGAMVTYTRLREKIRQSEESARSS